MNRDEWIEAAVLELVNDGGFYNVHKGEHYSLYKKVNWPMVRRSLTTELMQHKRGSWVVLGAIQTQLRRHYDDTTQDDSSRSQQAVPQWSLDGTTQQPIEKEKPMPNTNVVVKTFVGDKEATSLTDDQLFETIRKEEGDIKAMEAIENKPKKLVAKIKERKANIDKLVELVDGRD